MGRPRHARPHPFETVKQSRNFYRSLITSKKQLYSSTHSWKLLEHIWPHPLEMTGYLLFLWMSRHIQKFNFLTRNTINWKDFCQNSKNLTFEPFLGLYGSSIPERTFFQKNFKNRAWILFLLHDYVNSSKNSEKSDDLFLRSSVADSQKDRAKLIGKFLLARVSIYI